MFEHITARSGDVVVEIYKSETTFYRVGKYEKLIYVQLVWNSRNGAIERQIENLFDGKTKSHYGMDARYWLTEIGLVIDSSNNFASWMNKRDLLNIAEKMGMEIDERQARTARF